MDVTHVGKKGEQMMTEYLRARLDRVLVLGHLDLILRQWGAVQVLDPGQRVFYSGNSVQTERELL